MADFSAQPQPRISSRLSSSQKLSNSISRRVRREVRFGDYVLGSTLGRGEFGKVKLGWRKDGKQPEQVAIKLIRKDTVPPNSINETKVFREINALKILSHPNIVRLEQVMQNDKYIGIVLEYASGGELFDYLLARNCLKDSVACRLFAQLVSGVHYLHSKGIVHRDLKLENLLLDKHKNIIITDFGFANSFHNNDLMSTSCGSPCYAAPELVVSDAKYVGQKVDVWSCGVILYAMLAGYLPFDEDPEKHDIDDILGFYKHIIITPLTFPEYVHPMPRDLLRKIIVSDPNKRIDLQTVRQHPWLAPHAHFLSVTPQEWDQSYLASSDSSNGNSVYKKQAQVAGQGAQLTRSQSVQVKSSTNCGGTSVSHGLPYSSSTTNTNLASIAQPQPQITGSKTINTSNKNSKNATITESSPLMSISSGASHSRRHSVQVGYTKGATHSQTQPAKIRRKSVDNSSSDEVLASLDILSGPSTTVATTTDSGAKQAINPISESSSVSHRDSSSMKPPASNRAESLQSSKAMPNRLPQARKPRPTSFQPTSAGFYSSESVNKDESPMNYHLPMSSEPRVGVSQGSALPGEISRPLSFRSDVSCQAYSGGGVDEFKSEVVDQSLVASSTSDFTDLGDKTITMGDMAMASQQTSLLDKPSPSTANTSHSVAAVPQKQRTGSKSHRRGANSISYGADKLFSKFLGNSSPPNRRHSIMTTASSSHSTESQDKEIRDKKRFSLLSFYSSYGDNTQNPIQSSSEIDVTQPQQEQQQEQQKIITTKTSKTSSSRSGSTGKSDNRKILEPPASDLFNQRQNRASPPRRESAATSKPKYHKDQQGSGVKEQSAARKVVEFFKRRSRIA